MGGTLLPFVNYGLQKAKLLSIQLVFCFSFPYFEAKPVLTLPDVSCVLLSGVGNCLILLIVNGLNPPEN